MYFCLKSFVVPCSLLKKWNYNCPSSLPPFHKYFFKFSSIFLSLIFLSLKSNHFSCRVYMYVQIAKKAHHNHLSFWTSNAHFWIRHTKHILHQSNNSWGEQPLHWLSLLLSLCQLPLLAKIVLSHQILKYIY